MVVKKGTETTHYLSKNNHEKNHDHQHHRIRHLARVRVMIGIGRPILIFVLIC